MLQERLAKLRLRKLEELRKEHSNNLIKSIEQANNYDSCFNCNKDGPSHVQQCLTCAAKYLGGLKKSLLIVPVSVNCTVLSHLLLLLIFC